MISLLRLEKKILDLYNRGEKRKASNQAIKAIENGSIFTNKELLKQIVEPFGYTIAHELVFNGVIFEDIEILKLTGEDRTKASCNDKNVLAHGGSSVAYVLAKKGHFIKNKSVWALGSEKKLRSVAHEMAANGYDFKDKQTLKLKDDMELSVAHEMAKKGYIFKDNDILELKTMHGFSVKDFQDQSI